MGRNNNHKTARPGEKRFVSNRKARMVDNMNEDVPILGGKSNSLFKHKHTQRT